MTRIVFAALLLLASTVSLAAAGPEPEPGSESPVEQISTDPITNWLDLTGTWRDDLAETTGTSVALAVNYTGQIALESERNEGKPRSAFSYELGVEQRLWSGASLYVSGEGGAGDGIDELVDTLLGFNGDAGEPRCIYVGKAFLTQTLLDDRLILVGGKLDLTDFFDASEVANDEDTQFLAPALVNNPAIPFPDYGWGAVVRAELAEWLYLMAGVGDAQAIATRTGFNTAFHGPDDSFSIYEVGLTPEICGRPGNYRLMFWYDPQPLETIDGTGTVRDDTGFALSFDQEVTDRVSLFFRYGFAHERVREIEHFWSLGGQLAEPIPGRSEDVFGAGMAQAILGDDFRKAEGLDDTETQFELYYSAKITDYLFLTPHTQVILDPVTTPDEDCAVVAGVRALFVW